MDKETLLNKMSQINGVQGAMILNKEGLALANSLPDSTDSELISAVISDIFTKIDTQSKRMQRGKINKFILETDNDILSVVEAEVNGENLLVFGQFGKDIGVETITTALDNNLRG